MKSLLDKIYIKIFKKNFHILILVIFAAITNNTWFSPFTTVWGTDFKFWFDEQLKEFINNYQTWQYFSGALGKPNIQIFSLFRRNLWSLFVNLGINYTTTIKITTLIPVALAYVISPYLLIKYYTNNKNVALFGGIFYSSLTSFYVMRTSHIPISMVMANFPLLIYFTEKTLRDNNKFIWNILPFYITFLIGFEFRILYLQILFLIFYVLFLLPEYILIRKIRIAFAGIMTLFLNMYWIIPTYLSRGTTNLSQIQGRVSFGNNLFNIKRALTLADHSWTGNKILTFVPQEIKLYFWIVPICTLYLFIIYFKKRKKEEKNKYITFYSIFILIGILLFKQNTQPFTNSLDYIRENIPSLDLYRTGDRFFMILGLSYTCIICLLLNKIEKHKKNIIMSLILIVCLFNSVPSTNRSIGGLYKNKPIPKGYIELKNFIKKEPDKFRYMWIPRLTRWSYEDIKHQDLHFDHILKIDKNIKEKYDNILDSSRGEKYIQLLNNQEVIDKMVDIYNIKYFVIPLQNIKQEDDSFRIDNLKKEEYINSLGNNKYIDLVKEIKNDKNDIIYIYELKNFKDSYIKISEEKDNKIIYSYKYIEKHPTLKKIIFNKENNLSNIKLTLSEENNKNWKIINKIESQNVFKIKEMTKGITKKNTNIINEWNIDLKEYCINNVLCNEDEAEIYLYFTNQAHFNKGFFISLIAIPIYLIGILGMYKFKL